MKKSLLASVLLFLTAIPLFAGSPIYFPQSTNCITLYNLGGTTQTAAGYAVYVSSIEFKTVGGLNPGTTNIDFYDSRFDTVGELITKINNLNQLTATGVGGGWRAALTQGSYEGNNSSSMTVIAYSSNVMSSTNTATLTIDAIIGMSYIIPKGENRIVLENLIANASYSSGSPYLAIYDGEGTGTQIRKETLGATTTDKCFNIPGTGLIGGPGNKMRLDIVNTVEITSAYLDLIYFRGN